MQSLRYCLVQQATHVVTRLPGAEGQLPARTHRYHQGAIHRQASARWHGGAWLKVVLKSNFLGCSEFFDAATGARGAAERSALHADDIPLHRCFRRHTSTCWICNTFCICRRCISAGAQACRQKHSAMMWLDRRCARRCCHPEVADMDAAGGAGHCGGVRHAEPSEGSR